MFSKGVTKGKEKSQRKSDYVGIQSLCYRDALRAWRKLVTASGSSSPALVDVRIGGSGHVSNAIMREKGGAQK